MREGTSTIKCLMAVRVLKLTGKQYGEIVKAQHHERHAERLLPEYCLRRDNGKVDRTEYYLQFVNEGDTTYCLFDIEFMEQPLAHEINDLGLEHFKVDWSLLPDLPNAVQYDSNYWIQMSSSDFLVWEVGYETSYDDYSGGYESDVDLFLTGYLDAKKQFQPLTMAEAA